MSLPDAPPPPSLSVENLALSRGGRQLFSGLSFSLRAGAALALRGPNGAGKTSLLLVLAGALRPETGSVAYRPGGDDVDRDGQLHLLLARNAVKPRLTVGENLQFWRAVNGATGERVEAALERVGLGGLEPIEAGHLSTGQQRRLALARLLVSRRPLWLLDEPSAALDQNGERLVEELVAGHCGGGGIAIVATHHDLRLSAQGGELRSITIGDGRASIAPSGLPA